MRLGEILVNAGVITPEQLARGLESQVLHGGRLGTNLVELGIITERQLAGTLSEQFKLPYVSADMVGTISPALIAMMPAEVAAEFRAFPIKEKGRHLYVCMADPANIQAVDALAFRLSRSLQPCVVTEITLDYVLERYYGLRRETRFLQAKREPIPNSAIVQIADGQPSLSGSVRMSRGEFFSTGTGEFFRGNLDGLPNIASSLAEAKGEAEVVESMKRFFAAAFPQNLILQLLESALLPVGEAGLDKKTRLLPSIRIPLPEDCFLRGDTRGVDLNFHLEITDPTLVLVCQRFGMPTSELTLIPVKHENRVCYVILGRGLELPALKKIWPNIKSVVEQTGWALQMISLRKRLTEAGTISGNASQAFA
jgi:hypothetical protein